MLGNDWVHTLIKRHKNEIGQKIATNIKKSRAIRETIVSYFENLRDTLANVPSNKIFNYDETKLQDDPGKQKVLFWRGTCKRACNFTKTAISIMMCGSAAGVLPSPYVIYKAEKM